MRQGPNPKPSVAGAQHHEPRHSANHRMTQQKRGYGHSLEVRIDITSTRAWSLHPCLASYAPEPNSNRASRYTVEADTRGLPLYVVFEGAPCESNDGLPGGQERRDRERRECNLPLEFQSLGFRV